MSDEDRNRADARVGTILRERYRIDGILGVGGMAIVYAATHRNKKRFAIKMLHPELSRHEETKQRFLREGYAANTVDHPGAVAVLDDDVTDDGAAFIVMEMLDGIEVAELAEKRGGVLSIQVVLAIADQVLAVLEAAHNKQVVHRDLKPANLFIMRDGTVKVLDFGIARVRAALAGTGHLETQTGALLGTPAFLPPEQASGRNQEVDGQTDLWALGATMFTLLSNRYVHEGENATQILIMAATQPARPLRMVVPNIPPYIASLIDTALFTEKARRFPNAAAMRAAVREAYRYGSGGPLPTREVLAEVFGMGNFQTKFVSIQTPIDAASFAASAASAGQMMNPHTNPFPLSAQPPQPSFQTGPMRPNSSGGIAMAQPPYSGQFAVGPTAPVPQVPMQYPSSSTAQPVHYTPMPRDASSSHALPPQPQSGSNALKIMLAIGIGCLLIGGIAAGVATFGMNKKPSVAAATTQTTTSSAAVTLEPLASQAPIASISPAVTTVVTTTLKSAHATPTTSASAVPSATASATATVTARQPVCDWVQVVGADGENHYVKKCK